MSFGSAGRLVLLAAGALLFVDLFLGWQEACIRVGAGARVREPLRLAGLRHRRRPRDDGAHRVGDDRADRLPATARRRCDARAHRRRPRGDRVRYPRLEPELAGLGRARPRCDDRSRRRVEPAGAAAVRPKARRPCAARRAFVPRPVREPGAAAWLRSSRFEAGLAAQAPPPVKPGEPRRIGAPSVLISRRAPPQ